MFRRLVNVIRERAEGSIHAPTLVKKARKFFAPKPPRVEAKRHPASVIESQVISAERYAGKLQFVACPLHAVRGVRSTHG